MDKTEFLSARQLEYSIRTNKDNLKFEKVIFLDIDGVLNDDRRLGKRGEPYLDRNMVKRLKRIIDETGAEIVLTSSWRGSLYYYMNSESESEEERKEQIRGLHKEEGREIIEILAEYGIKLRKATEDISSGPSARPLEIRAWLLDKRNVKRFVILDDDDFWDWNWLEKFLVLTRRENPEDKLDGYIRGLEDEHADMAIRILNEGDELGNA